MNAAQIASAKEMLAGMIAHRDAMQQCLEGSTAGDTILAWPNGLAVHMMEGKHPVVAGAMTATAFRAGDNLEKVAYPIVGNGKNELAVPRLRRAVLIQNIEQANDAIDMFQKGLEGDEKED